MSGLTMTRIRRNGRLRNLNFRRSEWILPTAVVIVLLIIIGSIRPTAFSSGGLSLLFSSLLPVLLVALSQMFIMIAGDIDLGVGGFVSLVNVIAVTTLAHHLGLGVLVLVAMVAAYGAMALLVYYRRVPAIVVTLGMSFVWTGVALWILPVPGGTTPSGIINAVNLNFPIVPEVIVAIVVVTALAEWGMMHTRRGAILRGVGSNPVAVEKAGWSVPSGKVTLYLLAGLTAVIAGLILSGQTTSGDPNVGSSYVLLSIAGVVVGGGAFTGGAATPLGTAAGSLAVGLLAIALSFLNIAADYQVGAQGLLLIAVLVVRWGGSAVQKRRALDSVGGSDS